MNFFNHQGEIEPYQINMHVKQINQMNMKQPHQMKKEQYSSYENCNVKNLKDSHSGSFDSKEALDWQRYTYEEDELNHKDTFLIDIPSSGEIEINDEQKLEEMYKCYEQNFKNEQINQSNSNDTITVENPNQYDQDINTNLLSEQQAHSYFINMYRPNKETSQETQEKKQQLHEMYQINQMYQNNNVNYSMNHTQLTALQESQKSLQDFHVNTGATNSQQTLHYDSRVNLGEIMQPKPYPITNHSLVEPESNQYKKYEQMRNPGFTQGILQEIFPQELYPDEVTTPNLNCSIPKDEITNRIVKECTNPKNQIKNNIEWQGGFKYAMNQMNPSVISGNTRTEQVQAMKGPRNEPTELLYNENQEQRGNSMSGFITRRTLGIHSNNANAMEPTMYAPLKQNQTQEVKIPLTMNRINENNINQCNKNWYETMNPGELKELYSMNHRRTIGNKSQVAMRGTHTLQPQSNVVNNAPSYINGKEYMNAQINEHYNTKHLKDILPEPKLYSQLNLDVPELVQGITTQHTNGIVNDCNADAILKYKDTWRLVPSKRFSLNQQYNNQAAQNSLEEFQKRLDESNAKTKQNIMNANFNALTGELTMNHRKEDYTVDPNKVYSYKDVHASFPSYNNSLVNEKIAQINANIISNNNNNNNDKINSFNSMNHFQNVQPQNEVNKINSNIENRKQEKEIGKKRMPKKQNLALCGDTILKHTIKEFVSSKMKDYFNINLFNHYI